jgi:hypothetical protein
MDFQATTEQYDEVERNVDVENNPPDGLIIHTAAADGQTMRVVDVWESADQFNRFREERLGAAVSAVMGEAPPDDGPGPEITELHNVSKP